MNADHLLIKTPAEKQAEKEQELANAVKMLAFQIERASALSVIATVLAPMAAYEYELAHAGARKKLDLHANDPESEVGDFNVPGIDRVYRLAGNLTNAIMQSVGVRRGPTQPPAAG